MLIGLAAIGLALALSRAATGTATLLLFLGFLLGGAGHASLHSQVSGLPALEGEAWVEGTVEGWPMALAGRPHFTLRVERTSSGEGWRPARFLLNASAEPLRLLPGDRVRARLRLSPAPREANPGAAPIEARWRAEGRAGFGTVVDRQIVLLGAAPGGPAAIARFRQRFARLAEHAASSPASCALLRALAVGDRSSLSPEINDDFGDSGLAHVLSVSGLHIAVVAAGLYRALRWLLSRSERLLLSTDVRGVAALAALPATWAYVLITGAEVPAVRSGIMATALFLAIAVRRDSDEPSSLAAALLAVLAWDPAALHAVSFQLSFAAVAGLVLLARPLRALCPARPPDPASRGPRAALARAGEALLGAACASLAASLATAPLVATVFHRASLVAVLSNAVALPVATGLTALAALAAAVLPASENATALLLALADPLARALLVLSRLFADLPFAATLVPSPSPAFVVSWYGALAGVSLLAHARRVGLRLALLSGIALALLGGSRLIAPLLRTELVVTFLSVGTGDSAVIQLPGGEALLLDGGGDPSGRFDPGERVVVPALAELGATRLRAAILSHPHPDHLEGLLSALRRVDAGEIWTPPALDPSDPLVARLLALARSRGIRLREVSAGEAIQLGATRIEVLAPPAGGGAGNDGSLVLRLRLGETSFLFPGDVEETTESLLLARAPDLSATVLKAPHHGSRTSSSAAFAAAIAPRHVVFSVGRNRFGFPHEDVQARYRTLGALLHRTDSSGAITFRTDGKRLVAEPYLR